jgi:ankyrin repeat protein
MTTLMHASQNGKTDDVALLLDRGANIEATADVRFPEVSLPVHGYLPDHLYPL